MLFESIATIFGVCGTGLGDGKYPVPSGFWLADVAIVLWEIARRCDESD